MIEYNLAAEYATLFIIFVILISFIQDYEENTTINRFLKGIYVLALFSSLSTILAMKLSAPGTGQFYVTMSYVANILYFATIPALTSSYLLFCITITSLKRERSTVRNYFLLCALPYGVYLSILLSNISNGRVFYITETEGYCRGPWYQLPFFLAALNIVLILGVVFINRKAIHQETKIVVSLNMFLGAVLLVLQAIYSEVIMTGLCNTMSIMAIHLYTQNKKKAVDQLTRAKNSVALRYTLDELIRKDEDFSLYVFSLRGFKQINERNGLEFGDRVLQVFTKELTQFFSYDVIYRYGGDEFAVLLKADPNNVSSIESVLSYFNKPMDMEQIDTLHLDLVCARVDNKRFGHSTKELISSVDYSISILKQTHGEPRYLYDTAVVQSIIEKNNMIQKIKHAIDHRMFQLCYQPMYSLKDRRFTQAEALVRMEDGDGGLISPDQFIDIAETTGLVVPMTFVILDIVCEDFRRLLDAQGEDMLLQSISVNFPYNLFLSPDVEQRVIDILNKYKLPPRRIKIEITERTFISDDNVTKAVMYRMREQGFVFELDDFGVDYSNMSTFLTLPMQIIKIDRSVLLAAMNHDNNMAFFKHLVVGIHATNRIIIVEGVEDQAQLDFILESNCEYIQGYFFSKPLQFEPFSQFIQYSSQKERLLAENLW